MEIPGRKPTTWRRDPTTTGTTTRRAVLASCAPERPADGARSKRGACRAGLTRICAAMHTAPAPTGAMLEDTGGRSAPFIFCSACSGYVIDLAAPRSPDLLEIAPVERLVRRRSTGNPFGHVRIVSEADSAPDVSAAPEGHDYRHQIAAFSAPLCPTLGRINERTSRHAAPRSAEMTSLSRAVFTRTPILGYTSVCTSAHAAPEITVR